MRSKNLFILVIPFLTVAAMVYGLTGTSAWFFDSGTSQVSMITSGTLDLVISGESLEGTRLEPGSDYTELGTFCSRNDGTTDLKYRGLFEADDPASKGLLAFTTMKVEIETPDGWSVLSEIPGRPEEETGALEVYFKFPDQDAEFENRYVVSGALAPGEAACYRLSVKLDPQTPNEFQDQVLEFVLVLAATQPNNPGWD